MPYVYSLDPTNPANTDEIKFGAQDIREFKAAVIERLETVFTDIDLDPLVFRTGLSLPSATLSAPTITGGVNVTGGAIVIGGVVADTLTLAGLLLTAASAAGSAGIRLPQGAAPGAPTNGDLWTTAAGIFVRIAAATHQLAPTDSPHFTGVVVDSGGLTVTAGGVTVTAGGLTVTAGGLTIAAGNLAGVTASFSGAITGGTYNAQTISVTAAFTGTVTVATGLTVTAGGVAITAGGLTVTAGGITATGNSLVTGTFRVTGVVTFDTPIADSNLATIATAGKVSNSATTATSANTASAIVARSAGGNFTAGVITADLTGNVTGNVSGTALNVTGIVLEAHGGTAQSTYATGDTLYASAVNTLSKRTIGADGTVLTASGGVPVWAVLSAAQAIAYTTKGVSGSIANGASFNITPPHDGSYLVTIKAGSVGTPVMIAAAIYVLASGAFLFTSAGVVTVGTAYPDIVITNVTGGAVVFDWAILSLTQAA